MKLNSPYVITISRQLGSGGAYIGQQLAKKLNIFYADREIINRAAKQLSLLEEELESREEKKSTFWQTCVQSYAIGVPDAYVIPQVIATDNTLFSAESDIIKHIASEQSAVIIGRCGSHILKEHPNHLSIFLHAEKKFRIERLQKLFNISDDEAMKMITKSDKERAEYHKEFTGNDWTDAKQYDISINAGKLGFETTTDIIISYLR